MNFVDWYKKRGPRFIFTRAKKLTERYNFNSEKAISRIRNCVEILSENGCLPTFFIPAVVVRRNLDFVHELQNKGCEIGVHGYQHIDMRSISPQDANHQLEKSAELFKGEGIQIDGFRCPYLSISDELIQELTPKLFSYSSNRAIAWMDFGSTNHKKNLLFDTIGGFYQPDLAQNTLSLPYVQDDILEIPVSIPDDLQMRDGMNYNPDEISSFLIDTFKQIHQRGELFNLMFHPELASLLVEPFVEVLSEIQAYKGHVWIAKLRDICAWWQEKDDYKVEIKRINGQYHLNVVFSKRATLLQRGLDSQLNLQEWEGNYQRVMEKRISIVSRRLPLVGLSSDSPKWVFSALDRKGYILVDLEDWSDCTVKLTDEFLDGYNNPVDLIAAIEDLDVPLVRFWPWPDGCRSAICLSGDLDALSLMDYATRLIPM